MKSSVFCLHSLALLVPFLAKYYVDSFLLSSTTALNENSIISTNSPTTSKKLNGKNIIKLNAISKKKIIIYDGAEYQALNSLFQIRSRNTYFERKICATFITGTEESSGDRYVGVLTSNIPSNNENHNLIILDGETSLHFENAAKIPKGVSDDDAISTAAVSLTHIHSVLPRIFNVGGEVNNSESFVSGKVIVLGGSEYAKFAAEGMRKLGAKVYLISNNADSIELSGVQVLGPEDDEEKGFADVIGEFDACLDTLYSETPGVKSELRRIYKCKNYVSTYTKSQDMIRDEGLIFGPGKIKGYEMETCKGDVSSYSQYPLSEADTSIIPFQFGSMTLQKLFDSKTIFPSNKVDGNFKDNVYLRSWSLKNFWEWTSWPRDVESENLRFGLPFINEVSLFSGEAFPSTSIESDDHIKAQQLRVEADINTKIQEGKLDPFVLEIQNVQDFNQNILSPKRNGVLFLTAPYCKTCKRLKPSFSRLARTLTQQDEDLEDFLFASADAMTTKTGGRELGRLLDIVVVPTFILFKDGNKFGMPLSISRLPSKKLERSIELLISGEEWDSSILNED